MRRRDGGGTDTAARGEVGGDDAGGRLEPGGPKRAQQHAPRQGRAPRTAGGSRAQQVTFILRCGVKRGGEE